MILFSRKLIHQRQAVGSPRSAAQRLRLTTITNRYLLVILGLWCAVTIGCFSAPVSPPSTTLSGSDEVLARAFERRARNLPVEGQGVVQTVLPDDIDGSRHQRFVIALASGQTLLISHNIDLAPRILGIREGDTVSFSGEYEWNPEGGVIHWTHRDPDKRHAAGWLKHDGKVYQ